MDLIHIWIQMGISSGAVWQGWRHPKPQTCILCSRVKLRQLAILKTLRLSSERLLQRGQTSPREAQLPQLNWSHWFQFQLSSWFVAPSFKFWRRFLAMDAGRETHFRRGWRATSPNRLTPACGSAGHWVWCPDWVRTPLWVWECRLEHLNQKETGQREREERDGRVRTVRGRGGGGGGGPTGEDKNTNRHTKTNVTAQKKMNPTHTHAHLNTQTEETCWAWMRQKQNSHQQQPKQKHKAQTVWGVYAKSTHPVMHMPCKKAKAPRGVSVCNPETREERIKTKPWDCEQLGPPVRVLRAQVLNASLTTR